MKKHQVHFLENTLKNHPERTQVNNKLNSRNYLRGKSEEELTPKFKNLRREVGNSVIYFDSELPKHHIYGSDYFDITFSEHAAIKRRERLLRKLTGILATSVIGALLFYIWFSSKNISTTRAYPISNQFVPPPLHIPDQILLYRILGNDLPPRHKTGQTLKNVRFILDNEPKFPNTKKWWILNRIVDLEYEAALINLLKHHKQEYIRIPFDPDEYMKQDFRLEDFPEPDFFHSDEYMRFTKVAKLRTIDYTYHEKNLYAMNNNGGRNTALFHGKSQPRARWILPFDGNCFVTTNAFAEISSKLEQWGDNYKYFIVPMARLLNNTELLSGLDRRPVTPEEPQIIFRNDADEAFNIDMRYGRRSKLELLWRLGVISPRKLQDKPFIPWESREVEFSQDINQYKSIGWVFRLFSGQIQQEENKKEASYLRALNRLLAIQEFLDSIDERLARKSQGFDSKSLFQYDEKLMNRERLHYWSGDAKVSRVVNQLIKHCDRLVKDVSYMFQESTISVNNNSAVRYLELKNPENVASQENFISSENLNENTEESMDILLDNDDSVDQNESSSSSSPSSPPPPPPPATTNYINDILSPKINLPILFENVTTLALAHYFSNHEPYARWAANLVRTFLLSTYSVGDPNDLEVGSSSADFDALNDEGYNFPRLNKVPRILKRFSRLEPQFIDQLLSINPSSFFDACRLLYRSRSLTHREFTELRLIASDWLEYLLNSNEGLNRARLPDHRGTLYDLQVVSLASFVDDLRLYLRVVNRIRMRIGKHFYAGKSGSLSGISQPQEISFIQKEMDSGRLLFSDFDQNSFRYTTLNLQYWMLLTRGIQNSGVGVDLWQYTAKDGQRLSKAMMGHIGLHAGRLENDVLKPLLHIAQTAHKASDEKRGIWHEHGDEHDYFQHFLKSIGGKMDILRKDNLEEDAQMDLRVGIGEEARKQGIPPFWMLGVA
ncbi:hypothetical protein G9A89_013285 [Geosiphon pyriformis]|nr:hypothetical protein G9A89_013285 [Geosiphon pyriformis]